MTISSGFFNSVSGDRKYNAKHFNEIFDGMLKDGIYTTIGDQFNVTAGSGMQVIVGTGRGWFKNTWIYNDAPIPFAITSSDPVYKRIDAIVIDINTGTQVRNNDIKYIMGTASSTPDKPTLIDEPTHKQYPIAWVMVNPGATTIENTNITDCKLTGEIPAVEAILEYSSHTKAEIDERFERDEKPSFNESQTEDNIASGESIFVIFGKIQKFINIIKSKLPVKYGGTGNNTFTTNAVLLGNTANAIKEKTSNTGAFYSDGPGQEPVFGTLPVNKGGTGATTAAQALTNLGVPSDVAKAMSKDVYCSQDINRSIINVANGGTGQTSLQAARNAMGLGNTTGALPAANGGTGQTSLQATRNAMGLGNTTGALPAANGGTGQTSLQAARNAMGLGNTTGALPVANGGTGQTSLQAARNAMGLGNTTGVLPAANGGTGQSSLQATRNAMGLGNTTGALPVANGGTGLNASPSILINLGTTAAANVMQASPRPGVTGTLPAANGGTGQTSLQATRNAMGLGNTTGALPVANGGTGATTAAAARTNLGIVANTGGTFTGKVTFNGTDSNEIGVKVKYAVQAEGLYSTFTVVNELLTLGTSKGKNADILMWQNASAYYAELINNKKLSDYRTISMPNSDGTIQVSSSSSRRVKENIKDMSEDKAKKILDVNVVNFDYIGEFGGGLKDQCGVIAEETLSIIPEAVEIADDYDESKPIDYKDNPAPSVDYRKFIPYLIKMVQIQQKEIDELKAKAY